jgi:hypothetical protein
MLYQKEPSTFGDSAGDWVVILPQFLHMQKQTKILVLIDWGLPLSSNSTITHQSRRKEKTETMDNSSEPYSLLDSQNSDHNHCNTPMRFSYHSTTTNHFSITVLPFQF